MHNGSHPVYSSVYMLHVVLDTTDTNFPGQSMSAGPLSVQKTMNVSKVDVCEVSDTNILSSILFTCCRCCYCYCYLVPAQEGECAARMLQQQ